jgi:hypothetical protein
MAHFLSSVSGAATDLLKIQRALISVSDKTLLIPLATYLHEQQVEILSTGLLTPHISALIPPQVELQLR